MALSWKDVFDGHKRQQDLQGAATRAADAGYKYLAWNGWVYKLETRMLNFLQIELVDAVRTDILVDNLI